MSGSKKRPARSGPLAHVLRLGIVAAKAVDDVHKTAVASSVESLVGMLKDEASRAALGSAAEESATRMAVRVAAGVAAKDPRAAAVVQGAATLFQGAVDVLRNYASKTEPKP